MVRNLSPGDGRCEGTRAFFSRRVKFRSPSFRASEGERPALRRVADDDDVKKNLSLAHAARSQMGNLNFLGLTRDVKVG
jgi:hypothetical protein